jgi:hypothetical protein
MGHTLWVLMNSVPVLSKRTVLLFSFSSGPVGADDAEVEALLGEMLASQPTEPDLLAERELVMVAEPLVAEPLVGADVLCSGLPASNATGIDEIDSILVGEFLGIVGKLSLYKCEPHVVAASALMLAKVRALHAAPALPSAPLARQSFCDIA